MNAMANTIKQDFEMLLNARCPSLCLNVIVDEINSFFSSSTKEQYLKKYQEDFSSNEHGLISFRNVVSLSQPRIYLYVGMC